MNDIYIYRIALPLKVHGTTVVNDDASYTVYINSRLSPAEQAEAEAHERYHIEHEHMYAYDDLARQEEMAVSRPEARSSGYGFVRRGEHLLYWEKLTPGAAGEEIRDSDILKRVVPCRTSPLRADVMKR